MKIEIQCFNERGNIRWTKMSDTEIEDILRKGDKDKDGYLTNTCCIICFCIYIFQICVV